MCNLQALAIAVLAAAAISLSGCGATVGLGPAEVSIGADPGFGVYTPAYYDRGWGGRGWGHEGFHGGGRGGRR